MMKPQTNSIMDLAGVLFGFVIFALFWFFFMTAQTGALAGLQSANPTEMNDAGVNFISGFWWSLPALFLILMIIAVVINIQRRKQYAY